MFDPGYWAEETARKAWPANRTNEAALRLGDFFCGCGGLTLGVLMACGLLNRQLEIAIAADVWPEALEVYKKNFSNVLKTVSSTDLSAMVRAPGSIQLSPEGERLARSLGRLDVIVAGPPCQGHSDLNNSSRRDDPRNLLYTIPIAFALRTKAKILIVENVPTVVHSSDEVVSAGLRAMQERGYSVVELFADIQDFGLPQTRRRHLLIASRVHSENKLKALLAKVQKRQCDVALWNFIKDLEEEPEDEDLLITRRSKISEENQRRIRYLFESETFDLPDSMRPACHRDKSHSYVSMYGRLSMNRPAQTITSGFGSMGQGRFVHPTQQRMITAHEAARIQGFPDYFDFSSVKKLTHLREMIGNAVPPPVAAVLISLLMPPLPRKRKLKVTEE